VLLEDRAFDLHQKFLELWSQRYSRTSPGLEFQEFTLALFSLFDLKLHPFKHEESITSSSVWETFSALATSNCAFDDNLALKRLKLPTPPTTQHHFIFTLNVNPLLAPVLYACFSFP
jgi:anaphase-promoting complex subunit 1